MSDNETRARNIGALRDYLVAAFPGHNITDFSPPRRGGIGFRVHNRRSYVAVVTDECLDDLDAQQAIKNLNQWDLAGNLKDTEETQAIEVRRDGLHVEPFLRY